MGKLYNRLMEDVRFQEGLKSCINCGTCTAICPAAAFYDYDPRRITNDLHSESDEVIEGYLKGETIWFCGECMSCKTRCPRGNTPGLLIMALRSLSQDTGFFVESARGRQQLAIKRTVGEWILKYGYCLYPAEISIEMHPEQGPVWDWQQAHLADVFERLGGNMNGDGPGILRKIPEEALDELRAIFRETGGMDRFDTIENCSEKKAAELGIEFGKGTDNEYFRHIYSHNPNTPGI
jgi:heterodisulfide reductase subunit C